jgi:hypothetical protein
MSGANVVSLPEDESAGPFRLAIAEYWQAHAHIAALEADADDGSMNEALTEARRREWDLVKIPAAGLVDIRYRAHVVQDMFSRAALMGPPSDKVHLRMLDTLIAEVLSPMSEE